MEGPLLILVDDDLEKAMSLDEAVEARFPIKISKCSLSVLY